MYCKHCGNEIEDSASFCPHCGARTEPISPSPPPAPARTQKENTIALVGLILAFVMPFAGLICSIMGYNKAKSGEANHKDLAVAGIIVSALMLSLVVLTIVIYVVWLVALFGGFSRLALIPLFL